MKFNPLLSALYRLVGRCGARLLALMALALLSMPLMAATITVNDLGDAPDAIPNDGICATAGNVCTLRAAIVTAFFIPGSNVIVVPAGTIVLGSELLLQSNITVNGAGAGSTIVSGSGAAGVFRFGNSGLTVSMNDLTITNGAATAGAGVYVTTGSTLNLTRAIVTNNNALTGVQQGGGIYVGGTLNLTDSTVSNNSAGFVGGGVRVIFNGTANIVNSAIVNNTVTGSAANGGGIVSQGTLNILNSTISGNSAPLGGPGGIGLYAGSATVRFSTLTANTGKNAGTQLQYTAGVGNSLDTSASIVAGPVSGANCAGNFAGTSTGNNLDSANTCGFAAAGDLINSNPQLAALANNGGPTQTHALLAASPAINAGPTTGTIPATDQRGVGFARVQSGRADIGAYESAFAPPVLTAPVITSAAPTPTGTVGTAYSFTVVATGSAPIAFSIGTGSLSPGLTLNATTGVISGTPTASGTFTGTIVASNGTLPNASQAFSIVISPAGVTVPSVSVGNASIAEGNAGTSVMNFPVTLSSAAPVGGVTITYSTADGTATAGSDYVAVVGATVTIAAGGLSGNLPVTIYGDTTIEPDETFTVTITGATNATLGTATATGTIFNDDTAIPPRATVQPVPVNHPLALLALMLTLLGFTWRRVAR